MAIDSRPRIGAVSYLNTRPLVYRLTELAPQAELVFDVPSRLSDALAAGELDVALIPSIELFHSPDYTIVSDACIACRGPVLSVKLLSRVPIPRIRTLALDEGSRTSVVLVQVLLRHRFGLAPRLEKLPIGARYQESTADAVLLIGDRAIHAGSEGFAEVWDLGDQWCRWAELPFVFAMWAARQGTDLAGVDEALARSRDLGVANLEEIAQREAASVGLEPAACLSYLRDNLHFYLGERERQGLELFHRKAAELGLVPRGWELAPR
jgi:chorismate dehydratase